MDVSSEPAQLCLALLDRLKRSVEARGAILIVYRLPLYDELKRLLDAKESQYGALVHAIAQEHEFYDAAPALARAAKNGGIEALYRGHYSPLGNAVVAADLSVILERRLKDIGRLTPPASGGQP